MKKLINMIKNFDIRDIAVYLFVICLILNIIWLLQLIYQNIK